MLAYKIGTHRYGLYDESGTRKGECFQRREEIKDWGGYFNRDKKRWECSLECAIALDAKIMYRVIIDKYCHMIAEQEDLATNQEIEEGFKYRNLCICDGHEKAKILKILGEAEM